MTDLVQWAKRGDPKAIATLLNRQLNPKGITVKATVRENTLDILLESAGVLKKDLVIAGMHKRLVRLNPDSIQTVRLRSLQTGAVTLSWSHEFDLFSIESSPATESISPIEADLYEETDAIATSGNRLQKLKVQVKVGELVLLGFSFVIFAILCYIFRFNFFAGILLAFIPATIAHNRSQNFLFWYAYGLVLYFPAILHSSFIKGLNLYGISFFFLGTILAPSLSSSIILLLLIPNLAFAFIPALIVYAKKCDFLNWYVYGLNLFLVAFFHALLIKTGILENSKSKNLENTSFTSKDLSGRNFQNSNLKGADFSKSKLVGVNFKNANLQNANFANANIWATDFEGANLTGSNFNCATNRYQHWKKTHHQTLISWYILIGIGLGVCQLLLWILSFGSPLGLILSGEPEISWLELLTRPPIILSVFLVSLSLILNWIGFSIKRRFALILILGSLGLASSLAMGLSLLYKEFSAETILLTLSASIASILIIFISIGNAIQAWRTQKWTVYSTAIGIMSAMGFWTIALASGRDVIDRYQLLLVPPQLPPIPQLAGVWAIAVLAAWGAIAGNAIGILADKRTTRFRRSNLTGANFTRAELYHADFTGARTRGTNWGGAKLINAIAFPRLRVGSHPPQS
ncbi:MAG: pentapeptide repeat-containing protein [Cyanobacteriota bacterium]|nr:pentapeptide repeat-containing protein [Cyanobacteriota bacterium]